MAAMAALKILALGPNPALQRVLQFGDDNTLALGGVNRATSLTQYVGGKGQGVASAINRWSPGSSVVAHFLGGDNGRFVEDSLATEGIAQITQYTAAATRICTTCLDLDGRSTECVCSGRTH
jgi:fructose-1-phosphate kinase PfkB-like protein